MNVMLLGSKPQLLSHYKVIIWSSDVRMCTCVKCAFVWRCHFCCRPTSPLNNLLEKKFYIFRSVIFGWHIFSFLLFLRACNNSAGYGAASRTLFVHSLSLSHARSTLNFKGGREPRKINESRSEWGAKWKEIYISLRLDSLSCEWWTPRWFRYIHMWLLKFVHSTCRVAAALWRWSARLRKRDSLKHLYSRSVNAMHKCHACATSNDGNKFISFQVGFISEIYLHICRLFTHFWKRLKYQRKMSRFQFDSGNQCTEKFTKNVDVDRHSTCLCEFCLVLFIFWISVNPVHQHLTEILLNSERKLSFKLIKSNRKKCRLSPERKVPNARRIPLIKMLFEKNYLKNRGRFKRATSNKLHLTFFCQTRHQRK